MTHKHRHNKHQCHKGEEESANGAGGKGEPETILNSIHEKGNEPHYRGGHRQQYGDNLVVVGPDESFPIMSIFVHQIDASIDGEST